MAFVSVETLVLLRTLVGYLGEREQHNWWQSAFFSAGSRAFLAPLFARTQLLAQCNGVTQAAALFHDDHIGTGNVYHLFRLPEDMEQSLHQALHKSTLTQQITVLVTDKVSALEYMQQIARDMTISGIGPTQIGDTDDLRQGDSWVKVAALYRTAFQTNNPIYPYFTERSS